MDHRNDAALQFLATRRSHPPKMMTGPGLKLNLFAMKIN